MLAITVKFFDQYRSMIYFFLYYNLYANGSRWLAATFELRDVVLMAQQQLQMRWWICEAIIFFSQMRSQTTYVLLREDLLSIAKSEWTFTISFDTSRKGISCGKKKTFN